MIVSNACGQSTARNRAGGRRRAVDQERGRGHQYEDDDRPDLAQRLRQNRIFGQMPAMKQPPGEVFADQGSNHDAAEDQARRRQRLAPGLIHHLPRHLRNGSRRPGQRRCDAAEPRSQAKPNGP